VTRDISAGDGVRADLATQLVPEQRATTDQSGVLTIIGTITSQVALVTALFYYFGWVYIHSFYAYFGIDTNLLGYSTADYVLRSLNVAFLAFMYLAFAALTLFAFHHFAMVPALMEEQSRSPLLSEAVTSGVSSSAILCCTRPRFSQVMNLVVDWVRSLGHWRLRPSGARWIIDILQVVAVILALAVFSGVIFPEQLGVPLGFFLPLLLMFSVSALGYIAHVRSRYPDAFTVTATVSPTVRSRMYTSILLTLGFVAGLWAVSLYGDRLGTRHATDFVAQLSNQSEVVIYSTERIALNGPGINVSDITPPGIKYHCQYTGLRLLVHTPDKLILLPAKWQHGHDRVFLLRDDNSIRIDIIAR
jgi:hypothetical protein